MNRQAAGYDKCGSSERHALGGWVTWRMGGGACAYAASYCCKLAAGHRCSERVWGFVLFVRAGHVPVNV